MAVREFRIAQPKPKRVEGLSFEVSVSAVCHRVVFKRRELIHALIEGYRQPPGRVIPAGQGLGDGASPFFARVPGVEDCVRMLCRPIHRKCAAVHEHNHKRLTRFAQSLQECFFFRGKIKVGAISALEAGDVHLHLLPLELGSDTHYGDHSVRLLRRRDRICNRIGNSSYPNELDAGSALTVFDPQCVPVSFFKLKSGCRGFGIMQYEVIHNQVVVEPEPAHRSNQSDAVGAGFFGRQRTRPSH